MLILETLIAGFAGTLFMTLTMTVIHRTGWANADMVRALGSLATRSMDNAVKAGIAIHVTSGLLFAFPYGIFLGLLSKQGSAASPLIGAVLGLLHGIVVGFLLVAVVSEKHPVEKFRKAGLEVAVAHVLGHVGYGLGVGAVFAALDVHWSVGL